jgi:formylglycine-generating enzyme required for sulfatase activity
MSWLHRMLKLPAGHVVALALVGSGLPLGLQAQDNVNWAFAPLELRPYDDLNMVVIPAGSFTMGSEKNSDEKPPHTVHIRSFLMGKTEVTQKQWRDVMGSNPSRFSACGSECPVENVSWNDLQQFIAKLIDADDDGWLTMMGDDDG